MRLSVGLLGAVAVLVFQASPSLAQSGETCERHAGGVVCFQVLEESCDAEALVAADTCIAVLRSKDEVFLEARNADSGGRLKVCVTSPSKKTECRYPNLRLSPPTGEFLTRLRYAKRFHSTEPGRYAVSWFGWSLGTETQIDRTLHFRLASQTPS